MMPGMRIVAVEEHFATPEMRDAWSRLNPTWQDDSRKLFGEGHFDAQLDDLADARIHRMDAGGVDVAVLSLTTPGVQNLDAADAALLARHANDLAAARPIKQDAPITQGAVTRPSSHLSTDIGHIT